MLWTADNADRHDPNTYIYPRERLKDLSVEDLNILLERHLPKSTAFWSFQICNAVAAELTFNRKVQAS